jgi:hypothetical protein
MRIVTNIRNIFWEDHRPFYFWLKANLGRPLSDDMEESMIKGRHSV